MKVNLGIRNFVLGSTLAIAGCVLTGCNNTTTKEHVLSTNPEDIEQAMDLQKYDVALEMANRGLLLARTKEIADSTEFVNNPNRYTMVKYNDSQINTEIYRDYISIITEEKEMLDNFNAFLDTVAVQYAEQLRNKAQ